MSRHLGCRSMALSRAANAERQCLVEADIHALPESVASERRDGEWFSLGK